MHIWCDIWNTQYIFIQIYTYIALHIGCHIRENICCWSFGDWISLSITAYMLNVYLRERNPMYFKCSPNACKGQTWTKAGNQEHSGCPSWVAGTKTLKPSSLPLTVCAKRKLESGLKQAMKPRQLTPDLEQRN